MIPYNERTVAEIKEAARRIMNFSGTDDNCRKRLVTELGYPYAADGIAIRSYEQNNGGISRRIVMLMMWGPHGEIISL